MRRRTLWLTMLLAAVLSGCNTMAGVGRDVEAGGNAIERSATRNR